jgi:cellulose synthase/poly-beta-1,6-N-acetylglucosamine synthase-like glycosyltransferase
VRNAGARAAQGDFFFFVDADTEISETVLRAALSALEKGAVGGGAWVVFAGPVRPAAKFAVQLFSFFYMRVLAWAAGCFLFAARAPFEAVGGFDETLYACEEIVLSRALKRQGRFVVLREAVATSARKLRTHSTFSILPLLGRFLIRGSGIFRQRKGLEWWYDGKRKDVE